MPPRKTFVTGKKPKAHKRASMSRDLRNSAAPSATPLGPSPFRLKINPPRASSQNQRRATPTRSLSVDQYSEEKGDEEVEEDQDLPVAQAVAQMSRSGRVIKAPRYDDFAYGSDTFILSSIGKAHDEEDEGSYHGPRGSSPILLQKQPPNQKRGRPFHKTSNLPLKNKSNQPALPTIQEDSWPAENQELSTRRQARSPPSIDHTLEGCVDQIIGEIGPGPKVAVELPIMEPDGTEVPYTATLLMQVYLRAHEEGRWHICDLVADTWIRAFHDKRRRQEHNNKFEEMCWRFNESLYNRRTEGRRGFDRNAPNWSGVLNEDDPLIDIDVTDFNPELLAQLYTQTNGPCAAGNLWADAMALCGSKLENRMQIDKRRGVKWNDKLIYDIMCTTLRMTRRKLTLKIEETTEGAWCKRYHMHTIHGKPCYRKIAYDRKMAGDDSSDEDDLEEEPLALVTEAGIETPAMLGIGAMNGGDVVMGEAVDEDAEGESDNEYAG